MNALWSTTLISVAVIVSATVSLALGQIDQTAYLSLVVPFGGVAGLLHVAGGRKPLR